MTKNKAHKQAVRQYAQTRGTTYTRARREIDSSQAQEFVPTGMTRLDALLGGGLPRGAVSALWAATGVGTSMFGLTLARIAAMSARRTVVVTAEDNIETYYVRLLAATTGVTTGDIMSRRVDPAELARAGSVDWASFLNFYEPPRMPLEVNELAQDLRNLPRREGYWPALVVVDDLGAMADDPAHAVEVLAKLATDLRAAILIIQALPAALCRSEPTDPDEFQAEGLDLMLTWPERVPSDQELRAHRSTGELWRRAGAALTLTTPDDRRSDVGSEVVTLDLTVHDRRGRSGAVVQVRRDGPRARFLPGRS